MRKDDSGIHEWCKHTRNAGKRRINKTNRKKVKGHLRQGKFSQIRAPRTQQNTL